MVGSSFLIMTSAVSKNPYSHYATKELNRMKTEVLAKFETKYLFVHWYKVNRYYWFGRSHDDKDDGDDGGDGGDDDEEHVDDGGHLADDQMWEVSTHHLVMSPFKASPPPGPHLKCVPKPHSWRSYHH